MEKIGPLVAPSGARPARVTPVAGSGLIVRSCRPQDDSASRAFGAARSLSRQHPHSAPPLTWDTGAVPPKELRVSVVMTTFQGARHVRQQLDSILDQSQTPDEIVISDDASTDDTWQILTTFAEGSEIPLRLYRQERNVGLRRNVEAAITAASGSIIVLADQDDLWAKDKIETLAAAFADPAVMLWFSDAGLIDGGGTPIGGTAWEAVHFLTTDQDLVRSGAGLRRLLHGQTVTGATLACRAEIVRLALPLPAELEGPDHLFLHDGWLAVLADLRGRVAVEPRTLTSYRQHPAQVTAMSMAGEPRGDLMGTPGDHRAPGPPGWPLARTGSAEDLRLDHARVHLVAERLRAAQAIAACRPNAVRELLDLEEFLEVRVLPRSTPGRRARVVRQVRRGAYSRFARGLRTAALDLL